MTCRRTADCSGGCRDTHFIFFNRCRGCCKKIKYFFHIACLPSNLNIGYSEVLPELSDGIIEWKLLIAFAYCSWCAYVYSSHTYIVIIILVQHSILYIIKYNSNNNISRPPYNRPWITTVSTQNSPENRIKRFVAVYHKVNR